jgi:uncharacterized Fe-S cluster protein YjdI
MAERKITKHYPKEDISVVWQPHLCIHSTRCFTGLPEVFNPRVRPWINPEGSSREAIINQVAQCPSGALSIKSDKSDTPDQSVPVNAQIKINATGPYMVKGPIELINENGDVIEKKENFSLCRCGHSSNKPFCDGSHRSHTDWLERKK